MLCSDGRLPKFWGIANSNLGYHLHARDTFNSKVSHGRANAGYLFAGPDAQSCEFGRGVGVSVRDTP
jgi:hypothetical protein